MHASCLRFIVGYLNNNNRKSTVLSMGKCVVLMHLMVRLYQGESCTLHSKLTLYNDCHICSALPGTCAHAVLHHGSQTDQRHHSLYKSSSEPQTVIRATCISCLYSTHSCGFIYSNCSPPRVYSSALIRSDIIVHAEVTIIEKCH